MKIYMNSLRNHINLREIIIGIILMAFVLHAANPSPYFSPSNNNSAGFLNGKVISLKYTTTYFCSPSISVSSPNISESIKNLTTCAQVVPTNVIGTFPIWAIVPSYASFSVYGYNNYNSTPEGFPTYNGSTIITDCGAGGTPSACGNTPEFVYTKGSYKFEQSYGIFNGIEGVPEGLLPFPAHDYIMLNNFSGYATPLYVVIVRVFDPNIFPNATTGKCEQVAPSNLSDPTGNCLTSFTALRNAVFTQNIYIPQINAKNQIWYLSSNSDKQAVIVLNKNITGISNLLYPNTNMYLFVESNDTNYYSLRGNPGTAQQSFWWVTIIGVIVAIIIGVNIYWIRKRTKKTKNR